MVSTLYVGITALLVTISQMGSLGNLLMAVVVVLAAYSLTTTPIGIGYSAEGVHMRSLLRRHRIFRWEDMREVRAGRGQVALVTPEGRTLRLPDPTGKLAKGAEAHLQRRAEG